MLAGAVLGFGGSRLLRRSSATAGAASGSGAAGVGGVAGPGPAAQVAARPGPDPALRRDPRPAPSPPAPVAATSPRSPGVARLELEDGSGGIDLVDREVSLGRGTEADLRIRGDSQASRRHAVVRPRRRGDGWELEDAGSANGTELNGHRIPDGRVAVLRSGDRIGIGSIKVVFRSGRPRPGDRPAGPDDEATRVQ